MPERIVIADTSCLIALTNIEAINILKELYKEVFITEEILNEFGESVPKWIKVEKVKNINYKKLLDQVLDPGEASAIALALDFDNVLLILDDLKGRKEAEKLGFKITGTLGVLYKAKELGKINNLKEYLEKLKNVGFRISENIEKEILKKSNES
jgi:predicted nucleic acid-binding protein